jgi:hypothetical protein
MIDDRLTPLGERQHNGLVRTFFHGTLLTNVMNVASLARSDRFVHSGGAVYEVTDLQWRICPQRGLRINCFAIEVGQDQKLAFPAEWLDQDPILPINRIMGCRR